MPTPRRIQVGDTVRHKERGTVGKAVYSSSGISIQGVKDDGTHWHTLGFPAHYFDNYWEVIDNEQSV